LDYIGTASPISYIALDSFGQTASAEIFVVVTPTPVPLAVDDYSSDAVNRTQTISLVNNDSSPAGYPITPGLTLLCGLDPAETSPSCSQTVVTIADQGTLVISNGVVTFTPEQDFIGQVSSVSYQVENSYGEKATAVIYITVTPAPVVVAPPPPPPPAQVIPEEIPETWPTAFPDRKSGPINKTITLSAWLNDQMADSPLTPESIRFCKSLCLDSGDAAGEYLTEHVVPEGTWSIDLETGLIHFTPVLDWHGSVSINYAIWSSDAKMAHSTVTVVISPPPLQETLADTGFTSQQQFVWAALLMLVGFGLIKQSGRRLS
jgi:CshA-type fibril repeat protein